MWEVGEVATEVVGRAREDHLWGSVDNLASLLTDSCQRESYFTILYKNSSIPFYLTSCGMGRDEG